MNSIKPTYSVIVPVYNSEDSLAELVERIDKVMSNYGNYELLLIDDFSTDNSWEKLLSIKNGRSHIRLIRLTKNFGQAAVLVCGINESNADLLITIDDDLQYPPEEIPKLISKFDPKKHYLVFGVAKEKKMGVVQRLSSDFIESFLNRVVLGKSKKIRFSTFRIFTKKTYKREQYSERTMRSVQVFFTMVSPGLMDYVYVDHTQRKKGTSNYNYLKRLRIALDLIFITTEIPIYLFLCLFMLSLSAVIILPVLYMAGINLLFLNKFMFPLLLSGLCVIFFGFVVLFGFLKKLYLGYLGAEAYAIWEEA